MMAGIDIGGTNTHGVLVDGNRLKASISVPGNGLGQVKRCFSMLTREAGKAKTRFVITGGGARRLVKGDLPAPFIKKDEIRSIGSGGVFLSKKKDVFVVSIGTGTAFVSVRNGRARHVGGTGVGGGTIYGLSTLMLNMPVDEVERIARTGKPLDLTVKDIVGRGVGRIPGSATASNFGKASPGSSKAEIASSLLNMIGESIGVMAYFAAKSVGQEKRILVCGRVAMNGQVKNRITETVRMLGGRSRIPPKAEFCAAIGAAL